MAMDQLAMFCEMKTVCEFFLAHFTFVRQTLVNFYDMMRQLFLACVHSRTLMTLEPHIVVYNTLVLAQIARV